MSDNPFRHPWPKGSKVVFMTEWEQLDADTARVVRRRGTIRKYYPDAAVYMVLTAKGSEFIHETRLVLNHE